MFCPDDEQLEYSVYTALLGEMLAISVNFWSTLVTRRKRQNKHVLRTKECHRLVWQPNVRVFTVPIGFPQTFPVS